jgi:hypothetical protein
MGRTTSLPLDAISSSSSVARRRGRKVVSSVEQGTSVSFLSSSSSDLRVICCSLESLETLAAGRSRCCRLANAALRLARRTDAANMETARHAKVLFFPFMEGSDSDEKITGAMRCHRKSARVKPHFCWMDFVNQRSILQSLQMLPLLPSTMGEVSSSVKHCRSISIRKNLLKGEPPSLSIPQLTMHSKRTNPPALFTSTCNETQFASTFEKVPRATLYDFIVTK